MWVAIQDLPRTAGQPFYARLNQILDQHDFDAYIEGLCQQFYADEGRPGLPPGRYFRLLLIGYFEGLDAERAIAWRAADSFALREFLGLVLPDAPPDHTTISRTRRLIDLETHEAVFTWMLHRLADADLVKGKTVGIDATTLEANAALRSIVRRDSGERYHDFLTKLAQAFKGIPRSAQPPLTVSQRRILECSYRLAEANADMPYALFVPSSYRPGVPAPLIVDLHGLGISPLQQMLFDGTTDSRRSSASSSWRPSATQSRLAGASGPASRSRPRS